MAEAVVEQVVNERSRRVVELRDTGKFEEAQALLKQNVLDIKAYAASVASPNAHLLELGKRYDALSAQPAPTSAQQLGEQRKIMFYLQSPAAGSATRY